MGTEEFKAPRGRRNSQKMRTLLKTWIAFCCDLTNPRFEDMSPSDDSGMKRPALPQGIAVAGRLSVPSTEPTMTPPQPEVMNVRGLSLSSTGFTISELGFV